MNRNRSRTEQKSLLEGHTFSVPSITGNPFTPELVSAVHSLPSLQASLGEITDSLRTIRNLTEEISEIKKDLWEQDGFDHRIKQIAQQQADGDDELQQLRQENRSLKEDVNMLKCIVINLERTVIKNQNDIIDLKSRSMKQNILIHNLPEEDDEDLFVKIPELIKRHFKVQTSFANIHRNGPKIQGKARTITGRLNKFTDKDLVLQAQRDIKSQRAEQAEQAEGTDQNSSEQQNSTFFITPQTPIEISENRKKLLELNSKYWKANVKTRIIGEKLVFPNGSVHRDKVQKPKAEQILGMDQSEREALKKIKVTELETNEGGNIFRGIGGTTECYNHVRDMYKKTLCDKSHAKADHNILVYRFQDSNGQIHEGYNDDGEFGAGRRLVKMMQNLQIKNMTVVISRFQAKHIGGRRFEILENLLADVVLRHTSQ
ncbi:myosin-J heavy chain-like [Saccostrea cucullata]|uniref:myosin-J heavy chain-like n=1 Tax=Saccostrea cuccullata TaxID=36930 RepID=UPI002ED662B6